MIFNPVENIMDGGGNVRIATGSYTGTGTYGVDNPTTITFPFTPLIVLLSHTTRDGDGVWAIPSNTTDDVIVGGGGIYAPIWYLCPLCQPNTMQVGRFTK